MRLGSSSPACIHSLKASRAEWCRCKEPEAQGGSNAKATQQSQDVNSGEPVSLTPGASALRGFHSELQGAPCMVSAPAPCGEGLMLGGAGGGRGHPCPRVAPGL